MKYIFLYKKNPNFPLQRTPEKSLCDGTAISLVKQRTKYLKHNRVLSQWAACKPFICCFILLICVDEMWVLPLPALMTVAARAKCYVFVSFITKSHSCCQRQQLWEASFSVWLGRRDATKWKDFSGLLLHMSAPSRQCACVAGHLQ